MLLHFELDQEFEAFLKVAIYSWFIKSPNDIKLCQDRLKLLEVQCPVLGVFQLILEVPFKFTLDIVDKSLGVPMVLSKEGFEVKPHNRNRALITAFMLGLSEINNATEI